MRIYFDYPLATEENMKAVQEAINTGKESYELVEIPTYINLSLLINITGQCSNELLDQMPDTVTMKCRV